MIENAFIHGIEEKEEGGIIALHVYQTVAHVVVEVGDDGVGMSQEKIRQLLTLSTVEETHVGHSTGIGLTNVIRRLQLHYQLQDMVEIESKPGMGTTVRLLLPKKGE